jgi:hypothetical protein
MDLVALAAIAVGLIFVASLIWLATHHVDEKEPEVEIKPEHVAMMGVVTNDPTLAAVAYAVDPPPLEDEGLSIEDALAVGAIADTLVDPPVEIQADEFGTVDAATVAAQVWAHSEPDKLPVQEEASQPVAEQVWTHSGPEVVPVSLPVQETADVIETAVETSVSSDSPDTSGD